MINDAMKIGKMFHQKRCSNCLLMSIYPMSLVNREIHHTFTTL